MPETDRETEPFLHGLVHHHLLGVIVLEAHHVVSAGIGLVLDGTNAWIVEITLQAFKSWELLPGKNSTPGG